MNALEFPEHKKFAFTIFDDTDGAMLEDIAPVYELLDRLGMATTKSVWVFPPQEETGPSAHTLQDRDYLDFIKSLAGKGFEIAFHNASMCSNMRETTISAIEFFNENLGYYPKAHANHHENKENIYWGGDRLDFQILKTLYKMFKKLNGRYPVYEGSKPDSPYFWGDICRNRIKYVRNFVFREINLLRVNPTMPYKDPKRASVNYWFSSCEGADVNSFNQLLSSRNQESLEREGGVCIVYTHFADGFVKDGKVNPKTEELLTELSRRNGWFVPVSTLLDHLQSRQTREIRPYHERINMELRWFLAKVIHRTS